MDNDTLRLIARLKISSARLGMPLDAVQFASDRAYARDTLTKFADRADEEGVLLALQLLDTLRLTTGVPAEPAIKPVPAPAAPKPPAEQRYVGRLR